MKTNKFFSSFVKLFCFSSVLRWASFFSIRKIGKRGQKPYWTPSWRAPAAASFENYYYAILVFFMEKKTSFLLVAKQTLFFSQKRLKKTNTEVSGSGEGFLDNFFLVITYVRAPASLLHHQERLKDSNLALYVCMKYILEAKHAYDAFTFSQRNCAGCSDVRLITQVSCH